MKKLKYLFFTTLTIFIFSACSNLNNILDIENKKSEDIQEKSEIVNTSENLPKITEKKEYFSDGKLAHIIKLQDNIEIERVSFEYEPTGELKSKSIYKNNQLVFVEQYYKNGALLSEWNYSNNLLNGDIKIYYINGNLLSNTPYINGKKNGIANIYSQNGKVEKEYRYSNDILVEEFWYEYYDSGELNYKRTIKNDKVEGLATKYFKNGNKELEITFKNGLINGEYNTFYENGNLKQSNLYVNGKTNVEPEQTAGIALKVGVIGVPVTSH